MPLKDLNLKETWDLMYSFSEPGGRPAARPEIRLNYHRYVMMSYYRNVVKSLGRALGWTRTSRVVVVACGFGYLVEAALEMGAQQVIGVNPHAYISTEMANSEDEEIRQKIQAAGLDPAAGEGLTLFNTYRDGGGPRCRVLSEIMNDDITQIAARTRIRDRMGVPYNFDVITDSLIMYLTNSEIQTLSTRAHNVTAGRVIHFFTPLSLDSEGNSCHVDISLNWKSLENWKALISADVFVEAGTFRVL